MPESATPSLYEQVHCQTALAVANETGPNDLPMATVVRHKGLRISIVWIIPLLAAVVAIGIAIQRIRNEGPTITITFKAASGIEAGKTFIKYKDVTIGQVTTVVLTDDYSRVLVTAQIAKHAAGLIVDDAKFWIVQPQISLSGISGLGTLLSGQYIGFQAGSSRKPGRHFIALDVAPVITDQPGRRFTLKATNLGSVGIGAPIYYRSVPVGEVVAYELAADGNSIEATVFINAPYDRYVTLKTRFWNASGIEVSAGANGVDIRTESLVSVLVGGIAFDVPPYLPPGERAAANSEFTLYQSRVIAMTQPDPVERRFVLYFSESLRGLSVGAPVTMFGLPVGRVADVGLTFDPATLNLTPAGSHHILPRAAHRALIHAGIRSRKLRRDAAGSPRPPTAPSFGGSRAACEVGNRQPSHRRTVCRVRVRSELAEAEDRLEPGSARAARGIRGSREHRGETQQHLDED